MERYIEAEFHQSIQEVDGNLVIQPEPDHDPYWRDPQANQKMVAEMMRVMGTRSDRLIFAEFVVVSPNVYLP